MLFIILEKLNISKPFGLGFEAKYRIENIFAINYLYSYGTAVEKE